MVEHETKVQRQRRVRTAGTFKEGQKGLNVISKKAKPDKQDRSEMGMMGGGGVMTILKENNSV